MREFQVRHKIRNFLYSKGVAIILVVMIIFLGKATWGVFQKERESAENAVQSNRELTKLDDRKNLLEAEIGRLSTDEGVEEEIRSKYNVSKPGEHFLIIVDAATTSTSTDSVAEPSLWEKLKRFFY